MTSALTRLAGLRRSAAAIAVALPIVAGGLSACTTGATTPGSPGTYKPGPTNTGIQRGVVLLPHYGDITVTKNNTIIQNLDIHGFIKVRAANVTIRNDRVRGSGRGTTDTGLIDTTDARAKNVLVENCDLTHDYPSVWVDGILGHDYTVLRSNVHNVVDGFGVFNSRNKSADLNVTIEANWVHDLNYMSPDPEIYDNHTHNDGIQIQGTGATMGRVQVRIVGNNLQALQGPGSNRRSPYYPATTGQAIAVTPNVTRVHDLAIDRNWLDGGAQSVTMIPGRRGTGSGIVLSNSHFGTHQGLVNRNGVRARRPVLLDPSVSVFSYGNTYANGYPIRMYSWTVVRK